MTIKEAYDLGVAIALGSHGLQKLAQGNIMAAPAVLPAVQKTVTPSASGSGQAAFWGGPNPKPGGVGVAQLNKNLRATPPPPAREASRVPPKRAPAGNQPQTVGSKSLADASAINTNPGRPPPRTAPQFVIPGPGEGGPTVAPTYRGR